MYMMVSSHSLNDYFNPEQREAIKKDKTYLVTTASPRSLYYKPIYYLSISVRIKKIIQCIYNTFISKLYQTHGKISRCTFFYIPSTDNLQYPVCIIHFFRTLSIGECALDDNFGVSGNNPVNKLI